MGFALGHQVLYLVPGPWYSLFEPEGERQVMAVYFPHSSFHLTGAQLSNWHIVGAQ